MTLYGRLLEEITFYREIPETTDPGDCDQQPMPVGTLVKVIEESGQWSCIIEAVNHPGWTRAIHAGQRMVRWLSPLEILALEAP